MLVAEGWLLAAVLVASGVVFWHPAAEPFMLPKATIIVWGAVLLAALAAGRVVLVRRLSVPSALLGGLVSAVAVALVIATAVSATPGISVVGRYGRYTGLVSYVSYLFLFLYAGRLYRSRSPGLMPLALLASLAIVVIYGLVQVAGVEPFHWNNNGLPRAFSTFGNVDFAAGYVGALTPLAVWAVVRSVNAIRWRVAAGVLAVSSAVYLVEAGPFQGPLIALLGSLFVLSVWGLGQRARAPHVNSRVRWLIISGAVVVIGLLAGALGGRTVHFVHVELSQSFVERGYFYRAAVDVFTGHPLAGGGLDGFANHFTAVRPASDALLTGLAGTNAVHSVPLQMFTDGGVLLGLSYLSLMVFIAVRLVQGLRSADVDKRLLLAGLGSVWLAYQAQSLISIDVPPVALLNWVIGGTIVALAGRPDFREIPLRERSTGGPRRRDTTRWWAGVSSGAKGALVTLSVLAILACWFVSRPLRADLTAAAAAPLGRSGQLDAAIAKFDRAISLAPWEPTYRLYKSQALRAAHRDGQALATAISAAKHDPGNAEYALFVAQLADQQEGRQDVALKWYTEAVRRDPRDPLILAAAAEAQLQHGYAKDAAALAKRALAVHPTASSVLLLARAQSALGEKMAAVGNYKWVLRMDPNNAAASAGLESLGASAK